ncbi:MAG: hypothetical protein WD469_00585 [Paenibacillaceae bacterium]
MKNKRILSLFLVISVVIVTFSIYSSTSADGVTTQPGSVDDPMVTKSYVDEQVKLQVAAQINSQVAAEVAAQIGKFKRDLPTQGGSSGSGAALTVVQLAAGQTLMAGAGSELIVRTGFVTAVSTDGNGIPDVTAGKDIAVKSAIARNHLLIFPTDKRGIKPDPKKTEPIFVMVRGSYKLISEDGSSTETKNTPAVPPVLNPTVAPVVTPE